MKSNVYASASIEQKQFIEHKNPTQHVKLLATAGSGKTFSIIGRASYLIDTGAYAPEEIYVLTFSRNAKQDFVRKVDKMKATSICKHNIRTIDSFAKFVIDRDGLIDFSILSYSFKKFLDHNASSHLSLKDGLDKIKIVFVDEAQDLNHTQFEIICHLRDKLNVTIVLVGDPNQNIFQFRGGSDRYLVDFDAITFRLSTNYRSHKHLIDFSSSLRKYDDEVLWNTESTRKDACVFVYACSHQKTFEKYLVGTIKRLADGGIPLHKIAVLAPTRGYLGQSGSHRGLCYVANVLHENEIKAQQLYDDMSANQTDHSLGSGGGRETRLRDGNVSLMTFTASKGLEWDHVILVDVNVHLVSKKGYDESRYNDEQYLLYVAATRAKKTMYIFTESKKANPWLKHIPQENYKVFFSDSFGYGAPNFEAPEKTEEESKTVEDVARALDEVGLYDASLLLSSVQVSPATRFTDTCLVQVSESRTKFIGIFSLLAFKEAYALSHNKQPDIRRVKSLLERKKIVFCENSFIAKWFEDHKDFGWGNSSPPDYIQKFINENIDDFSIDMREYVFISNRFYQEYVVKNISRIRSAYDAFIDPQKINIDIENTLFLSKLEYSIASMHYFYIDQCDFGREATSPPNIEHFLSLAKNVSINIPSYVEENVQVESHDKSIVGLVDFVDDRGHAILLHFSMASEIRLQDKVRFIMKEYMLTKSKHIDCTVLNIALGTIQNITCTIDEDCIKFLFSNSCDSTKVIRKQSTF